MKKVNQNKVNTTADSNLPIDTGSWPQGEYTLRITDGMGGSLIGCFVIH